MEEKVIIAKFGKTKVAQTEKQWRYNHGQKLKFEGVDLPANYEVHFSNSKTGDAKTWMGDETGVLIPHEYFIPGSMIYAWIYVEEDGVGVTRREVRIPIDQKAKPTDQQPLPEEQTIIEQAIESLNTAVNTVTDKIDTALAEAKASGEFDGTDGSTIWGYNGTPITPNYTFYRNLLTGTPGAVPKINDLILLDTKLYKIVRVDDFSVRGDFYRELKGVPGRDGVDGVNAFVSVVDVANRMSQIRTSDVNGDHSYSVKNTAVVHFYITITFDQSRLNVLSSSVIGPSYDDFVDSIVGGCSIPAVITTEYRFQNRPFETQIERSVGLMQFKYTGQDGPSNPYHFEVSSMPATDNGKVIQIWSTVIDENTHEITWDFLDDIDPMVASAFERIDERLPLSGGTMSGELNMGSNKISNVADATANTDAVNLKQVKDLVAEGSGIFRGSFSTKAAFNLIRWQSTNPSLPYYVDNMDFVVILNDETHSHECWRYVFTTGISGGWAAQYRVNESPMSQAQINALNSGIDSGKVIAYNKAKQDLGDITRLRTTDKSSVVAAINELADGGSGTGATVFEFLFDGFGYVAPGDHAPTLEEVLAAGENVIAKATFYGDSEEIYLPLKGNDGTFTTGINNGTYFNIVYDLLDNVEVWHFITEEISSDSSFFVTYTQGSSSVTCDKTYSEIVSALSAPHPVVVFGAVQGLGVVAATCNTSMVDGTGAITSVLVTGPGDFMVIKHPASGAITMNVYEYAPIPAVSQGSTNPPTSGAVYDALANKYEKPSGGIPKTDLSSAVQTSLGKADTALQSAPVASVNGQTGAVSLSIPSTAADVGAVASNQGAANANKVLTVNSSGAVVPEDNRFVVTLTPTAQDMSGVMDKTVAEIYAAYGAGKKIVFKVLSGVNEATYADCTMQHASGSYTYPSFNGFIISNFSTPNIMIFAFTGSTNDGTKATYATSIYPLASGQWTGGSY